jgi:hypothetical protein
VRLWDTQTGQEIAKLETVHYTEAAIFAMNIEATFSIASPQALVIGESIQNFPLLGGSIYYV